MTRHIWILLAAFLLAASTATAVLSGVPDPAHSTVDSCLVMCPLGDASFHVVVRDLAGNTIAGSSVALNFSACPAVNFCPTQEPGTIIDLPFRSAIRSTNALGTVTFNLHAGGVCPLAAVQVYVDGVPLATRPTVSSPDQDGSLSVDATDQGLVLGKVGSSDSGADFDCDHVVGAADVAFVNTHAGHTCDASTPALPRSWGRLKMLYR